MALGPLARRQSGGSLSSFKEKQVRGQVCLLLPMRGGGGGAAFDSMGVQCLGGSECDSETLKSF